MNLKTNTITHSNREAKGKFFLHEDTLRDIWDNKNHICFTWVPKWEAREKLLKKIVTQDVPSLCKEIDTQVQEVQRIPNKNQRNLQQRHTIIKLDKADKNSKILKVSRQKYFFTYQRKTHKDIHTLFSRNFGGQKRVIQHTQSAEFQEFYTQQGYI